ncbi:MAG: HAD family hydrolase [Acidobacteria bacterium]|nr:MAG: HAD family hydrolase [Acidobacteriota bacterium]
MSQHRAVFLDRDGTMIEDVGYLDRLERLKLFPYTIDAVRLLSAAGFKVVVVTSQNGVAQGMLTEEFLAETHAHMSSLFAAAGGKVEGYYYCPHSPHGSVERYRTDCECRKPKPGMILAAARDHALDLSRSIVIGDRWRDVEMGLAAGTKAILVETGYGKSEATRRPAHIQPMPIAGTLIEAVSLVLKKGV